MFSKKAAQGSKDATVNEETEGFKGGTNTFIRSKKDNNLLPELQVKGDLFGIVDKGATLWVDADGIPYKTASSVEENYIEVSLKEPEEDTPEKLTFKGTFEFKNKTEFKGRARGDNISAGSILADKNVEREVNDLAPLTLADFNIVDRKRLKYEDGVTIDGIEFENSLEVCKYFIDAWVDACLKQTRLNKVKMVMGSGDTHRHSIQVPHQYKSERTAVRPLLLTEARKYVEEAYDSYLCPPLMEADEIVDAMAARAYDKAKATNTKIQVVKAANDKDARSKRGILFDWNKSFHFDNPQCWYIADFEEHVGHLELKKGKIKGGGSLFFAYQICMEDCSDEYNPRKYLPETFTHYGKGYGDTAFYKDFAKLTTAKEVFQKVVDLYETWFPKGLQYTAWDGTEIDEDTLTYLNKHFKLAYMLESSKDNTTIMTLLDKYGVDYSKITNNNVEKVLPLNSEDSIRSSVKSVTDSVEVISELLLNQKGRKDDLTDRMTEAEQMVQKLLEDLNKGMFVEEGED